jgi:hypothetical protein
MSQLALKSMARLASTATPTESSGGLKESTVKLPALTGVLKNINCNKIKDKANKKEKVSLFLQMIIRFI